MTLSVATATQSGGILDLADNDLIVASPSIPAGPGTIFGLLQNGYDNGAWDAESHWPNIEPAAITSSIALGDQAMIETLGYAQIGSGSGQLNLTTFDNQPVTSGDMVVKFTYYGDANLDGTVNAADQTAIANGITNHLTGWTNGDFTYAGIVSTADSELWEKVQTMTLPPGSLTLAANADFPVTSLPTTTPNGAAIGSWRVDWGGGNIQTFGPTDTVANPYSDANAQYEASFVALDANGNPIYYYPHLNINIAPPMPIDLSATESNAGEVDLAWDYDDTSLASNFIIMVTAPSGQSTSYEVNANTSTYAVTGLVPDRTYRFSVTAETPFANGSPDISNPATITAAASSDNLSATGPTTVNENDGSVLTLASGAPSNISGWTVVWNNGNGNTLSTDTVSGSSGTVSYPTGALDDLQATITAVDAESYTFALPAFFTDVLPAAPSGLGATTVSPNDVDLSWTNHSLLSTENDIYAATIGVDFTFLGSTGRGSTSYQVTGLLPNTAYTFEVVAADAGGGQSVPSGTATAMTAIDPWQIAAATDSVSAGGVTEGGSYYLDLSTNPQTGAPAFGEWTVNWGDGSTPSVYTTQDVTASHVFASDTSSATIQVTAATASGATIPPLTVTALPIAVDIIPTAPTNLVAAMASSTEIDLTWTSTSQSASGYDILRSLNGGAFALLDTVDGNISSYDDVSLNPYDSAQYEIEATGNTNDDIASPATAATPSITTPDGTPTFTVVAGPAGSDSAVLTWGYQGNDARGFELEEEDTSMAGTNFYNILNPTSAGTDTVGLTAGDSYQFRIRADHTDESVSDYVSGGISIPIADAPDLSVETVNVQGPDGSTVQAIRVGWSGGNADYGMNLQIKSNALAGNSWAGVWYGDQGSGDYPVDNQGADPDPDPSGDDQGFVIDPGVFGPGTYTYRIQTKDAYGNPTAWSEPESAAISGPAGAAPTLSTTGNTITATWPASLGDAHLMMSPDGSTPYVGNGETFIDDIAPTAQYDSSTQTYSDTAGNLQPGTKYDFVLWTLAAGDGDEPVEYAFGDASITTGGTAAGTVPMAPAFAHAVYDPSVGFGEVKLSWANTPNNETGYTIDREISLPDGTTNLVFVANTTPDQTTYNDRILGDNGPYYFRIYSRNTNGESKSFAATACRAIGGPDVTADLAAIRAHLLKIASIKAGAITLKNALIHASLQDQTHNWDITLLAQQGVTTSKNTALLPDTTKTVTVAGHVYLQAEVNYWLYGVWCSVVGADVLFGETRVLAHAFGTTEGIQGKLDWYLAGYYNNFNTPIPTAVPNVSPCRLPLDNYNLALQWFVGLPPNQVSGAN